MAERKDIKRLGEVLVDRGLITSEQLELALTDQKKNGGRIGEILIGWGYATEEGIVEALISQYHFPYVKVTAHQSSEEVIKLIPMELASRYSLVGLDKFDNRISIAMSDPLHEESIEMVKKETGCEVSVFISTYSEILRTIENHYQVRRPGST